MKVLVFGASGILGQHMRLCKPDGVDAVYYRQNADMLHKGCDLIDHMAMLETIQIEHPDVVLNLAGESNTDAVEKDTNAFHQINVEVPIQIADLCNDLSEVDHPVRYIHISSQAVFSGNEPPYGPDSPLGPVNMYGRQKAIAEAGVKDYACTTIIRPTFVLGVRPLPHVGRQNPLEAMYGGQRKQVADRWFSPLFARDAAKLLWEEIIVPSGEKIIHLGIPEKDSRYLIADGLWALTEMERPATAIIEDFPGIASRPFNTVYEISSLSAVTPASPIQTRTRGLYDCSLDLEGKTERAREIALFLGIREDVAAAKLAQGFGALHKCVNDDFRASNPKTDDELLDWYRRTESYIWELSAYHDDPGFNYSGICKGIIDRLKQMGAGTVLALGDGIGTFSLKAKEAGLNISYHDLRDSRTSQFAQFRFWRKGYKSGDIFDRTMHGWIPNTFVPQDAIVSLDFLEHVTDVEHWAKTIYHSLLPGGLFIAQNAFNIGSGPDGAIPMHLSCNDHFEKDWDTLLFSLGFEQLSSNWYRKPL